MKTIWKIILAAALATTMTTSVYAIYPANFVISSNVNITGTPGISISDSNGVLTTIQWGDLMYGAQSTHDIIISNVGHMQVWIIDGSTNSLTTTPALPSGLTLTWNLANLVGLQQCTNPNPPSNGITACLPLAPSGQAGSTSTTITMTLAAANPAPIGSLNFNIAINAYSTPSG